MQFKEAISFSLFQSYHFFTHLDRGLPQGLTKIPSRNKRHENHTRWRWQSLIARVCVILFLSYKRSFNALGCGVFFLFEQLAQKYLEDNHARWARFPCSPLPRSLGSGEAGHLSLSYTLPTTPSLHNMAARGIPSPTPPPPPAPEACLVERRLGRAVPRVGPLPGPKPPGPVKSGSGGTVGPWPQRIPPHGPEGRPLGQRLAPGRKGRPSAAPARTFRGGSEGERLSSPAARTDLYWWEKAAGRKEAEKESKEMKLDQLLVPGLEILSLEGTKGKNAGNPRLPLKQLNCGLQYW